MNPDEPVQTPEPRDIGLSWIRTTVPYVWAYILTLVARSWPELATVLANDFVTGAAVGVLGSLLYLAFRWLEKRLPPALVRILLGAATPPVYMRPGEGVAPVGLRVRSEGR